MEKRIVPSLRAPGRPGLPRLIMLTALIASLGFGAGGCAKDKCKGCPPGTEVEFISPRLQASDVLKNLQAAYKQRNIVEYAKLLADDFTFCFDPATRPSNVPECWDRAADSAATGRLFAATDISDIRITLTYGADVPVNVAGQERWRKIRVTDTFLEIDKVPPVGEVITLRVDGDVQDFYLRKGRNPADTLAASPTAREWFLVGWNDLARLSAVLHAAGARPATDQATTWSGIKASYSR